MGPGREQIQADNVPPEETMFFLEFRSSSEDGIYCKMSSSKGPRRPRGEPSPGPP